MTQATAIYRAVMVEIERRRLQLGWPMWRLDDAAGTQDGYYGKALYADTKSGRQCRWDTLDLYFLALFPEGYDVVIKPKKGGYMSTLKQRSKIRAAAAYTSDKLMRERMSEIGKIGGSKGGKARAKRIGKRRRRAIAKMGGKARWRKPQLIEITDAGISRELRSEPSK